MESYGKVHALGKSEVSGILRGDVYVEEKVDGSQFAFGVTAEGFEWCASRGGIIHMDQPQSLFSGAVETARRCFSLLSPGMTVRGEAVNAPRHNKLTYGRVPEGHLAVFDVQLNGVFYSRAGVEYTAGRLGLECVPTLAPPGHYSTAGLEKLVEGESFLGGAREGIVIKTVGGGSERAKAKIVGNAFREKNGLKPRKGSDIQAVVEQYRTEARWDKAIQHLREAGELTGSPKDIGKLLGEFARDFREECHDEIRDALWPKIWKGIVKGTQLGLAEHYLKTLNGEDDA